MDEQAPSAINIDVIVARHPEHGFVVDGYVTPEAETRLRRLGYDRNEDDVLTLTADLDEETARARHRHAAQVLAATGHAVRVLSEDEAANHADAGTPHVAPAVIDCGPDDAHETDETITVVYEMEDGSPTYDEQSADRVHVWRGEILVVTLTWHEGRWIDVEPSEMKGDTVLWRDVDTWLKHNMMTGEATE